MLNFFFKLANKQAYGCNLYSAYKESRICKFNLSWSLNELKRLKLQSYKLWFYLFFFFFQSFWICRSSLRDKGTSWVPSALIWNKNPWYLHDEGMSSALSWPFFRATVSLLLQVTHLVAMHNASPWIWGLSIPVLKFRHAIKLAATSCGIHVNGGKIRCKGEAIWNFTCGDCQLT